jgi:hypothetical protein
MFAHPEGSTGPCQFQRPTPCSQPAPCNIQPVPKNNALQCCAKPNPNYGSAVYRQESISIPEPKISEQSSVPVPDYKQNKINMINMSQSELMIVQMSNRLRMMEWMIVALLILTIVLLILHLRK